MGKLVKCITCPNTAYHKLSFEGLADTTKWEGNYCLECLVAKLRGMTTVWNNKIKKYCKNCQGELQDKRMKICNRCNGTMYIPITKNKDCESK